MSLPHLVRYLWVLPTSLVGLLFVPLAALTGGGWHAVAGVLEVQGGAVGWVLRNCTLRKGGVRALTLGHVVLGTDPPTLRATRAHERVHVRQCERWGPLFIPAYLAASVWVWARGGDAYRDNPFEREAYERE